MVERYPRESFTIADKLPGWKINEQSDLMKLFNESLARCGVDYFDFYLLHSIEKKHYASYEKYHCFEFLKELKKQDKIKYMGFAFHDNSRLLDDILTKHLLFSYRLITWIGKMKSFSLVKIMKLPANREL
ncbi:aldo/keto reductase [[Clostridium] spiroforme]|nr:aldo/keto reductase [Thomasclavelia spiroformis]